MKKIFFISCLLVANMANATTIQSTLVLSPAYTSAPPNFDTIILDWSTPLNSGNVTKSDLDDWTMTLLSSGAQVYQDIIISSRVVNTIGGLSRNLNDIVFFFDLDAQSLLSFDNLTSGIDLQNASGIQYNVFSYSVNSVSAWQKGDENTRQINMHAVPEPATLAFMGLGFASLGFNRKWKNKRKDK